MKWPSLTSLWDNTQKVVLRFPLQVIIAITAICICFVLIDIKNFSTMEPNLVKLLLLCNIAFVLLLATELFAEVHAFKPVKKWLLRGFCLALCGVLYFALSPHLFIADRFRIALLIFAFHLLVAFAPFIKSGNLNGFWAYNKVLFLQILTAGLYAFVLFAGLSVALLTIDGLFPVKVDSNIYMRLFSVVGIGFTSLFFLAGIPVNFKLLSETEHPYPKGLKIFTQYVLIPLLTIYLAILLVYEVKIIINWELPKGMVSTLILGYAVFGVLSLLLVYPIKEQEGNGWIRLFSKWFYLMMIPLVVLLLLAVYKRVDAYGITESRYILIILALWLSIITAYFLISKKDNIKIIPISLCVLALLATYGPQSAFSVSRYSQTERLKRMMKTNDAVALRERPQIVHYLVTNHGLISLQPFTKVDLTALNEQMEKNAIKSALPAYEQESRLVDTAYALLKVDKSKFNRYGEFRALKSKNENRIHVKGYDYVIPIDSYPLEMELDVNGIAVKITRSEKTVAVKFAAEPEISFNTQAAIDSFKKAHLKDLPALPDEGLQLNGTGKTADLTLVITNLTLQRDEGSTPVPDSFSGYLLIKIN